MAKIRPGTGFAERPRSWSFLTEKCEDLPEKNCVNDQFASVDSKKPQMTFDGSDQFKVLY